MHQINQQTMYAQEFYNQIAFRYCIQKLVNSLQGLLNFEKGESDCHVITGV